MEKFKSEAQDPKVSQNQAASASSIKLIVVRHGQTFDNLKDLCQGHTDGKLTELGETQATILGKRLNDFNFECCYVSDLGRTKDTYRLIIKESNKPKESFKETFSHLLREKGGGVMEGKPLKLISEGAKSKGIPIREYKPEKGECWQDVNARAKQLMKQIFYDQFVASNHSKDCLLVTHGGWIMELLNYIRHKEIALKPTVSNTSKNCAIYTIGMESLVGGKTELGHSIKTVDQVEEKMFKLSIISENDVKHLENHQAVSSKMPKPVGIKPNPLNTGHNVGYQNPKKIETHTHAGYAPPTQASKGPTRTIGSQARSSSSTHGKASGAQSHQPKQPAKPAMTKQNGVGTKK